MVYCPKCGKKNEEDAKHCISCGIAFHPTRSRKKHEDTCFDGGERHIEEECFGIPYVGSIAGIFFGILIILFGLAVVFELDIWRLIGPSILIIVGLIIIISMIIRLYRR